MATDMFYGAQPVLFEQAKQLRESMTPAEVMLWERLRQNRLDGFRFKAQHPIAYFIADFYCHKARLIVEVDGGVHDVPEQMEYDQNRTHVLNELGLTVIRFRNAAILTDINQVQTTIRNYLL
ncbi:endonuclease domain-containing protein [Fibrella sp. WM1]|uniref:endonuclease domain-containing protein n=1 Tax=Fibrella musci TaxID=3242485 RepID=UPI0035202E2A